MNGTIVNTLAIIGGSIVGLALQRGIPESYRKILLQAVGLSVVLIGIQAALKANDPLIVILSLAVGSIVGEAVGIEARLEALGNWLESRFSEGEHSLSNGFVTASLVFCVGSLAIVGSLESGLSGNEQILYVKSALDGITSAIFASTLGAGVLLSALSVLIYQGSITVLASLAKPFLAAAAVDRMTSVGGLLIAAIGINLLSESKLKVGNMLPAIFMPLVYHAVRTLL